MTPAQEENKKGRKASLIAGLVFLTVMVVGGVLPKLPNITIEIIMIALGGGAVLLTYAVVKRGWKMNIGVNVAGDMLQPVATIIGAALIAGAIAFVFRWEVTTADGRVWRLDRWTGNAVLCAPSKDSQTRGYSLACPFIPPQ